MKIEQKRLSTIHTFDFQDNFVNFAYKDQTGSGDVDVAYANLSTKTSIKIEDNTWWRNAGYLWAGIGTLQVGMGIAAGKASVGQGTWLLLGLICLVVYYVTQVKYTVMGYGPGSVFVIQDGKFHDQVVGELMTRRKSQLLSLLGDLDLESNLERERSKFEYLKEQGVLSAEEADAKIRQAVAAFGMTAETPPTLN